LQNKTKVIIPTPAYAGATLTRHALQIVLVRSQQTTMRVAQLASRTLLEAEINWTPNDCNLVTELTLLNNAIALGGFEAAQDVPMELTNQERLDYSNECRNQSRRSATLDTHRGQAYSLILGQCTQLLQDKMKQDASWTTVSTPYNPLELYKLIEWVILKQTEDQYPFAAIHEQNLAVLNTKQGGLSNPSGMNISIRNMTLPVPSEWNSDTKCCGNTVPNWLIQRAMTCLGRASKPQSDRQRKIDTSHIFSCRQRRTARTPAKGVAKRLHEG
jgi:hypothetical protein